MKVTAKVKWSDDCVTLRLSGHWRDVILSLYDAGQTIRDAALDRGLVTMNRQRRTREEWARSAVDQLTAKTEAMGLYADEFDDK